MSRVMVDDLWLRRGAPARVKRVLGQAHDPMRAKVPQEWRTSRYGRGMRWRCRWFQPTPDGRRMARTRSFARLADAEAYAAAMEDDVRRGRYHDPRQEQRPFADVAREWLDSKLDLRDSTRGRYERELRHYILPTFGGRTIGGITTRDVQGFADQLHDGTYTPSPGAKRSPRPLSARSMRNVVRIVLGGVLRYAVAQGWLASDPADRVTLPRATRPDIMVPTPAQVEDIADAMRRPTDRLIVLWQAYTGMRIGETLALHVRDVDAGRRLAHVRATWTTDSHRAHRLGPPKNGHVRDAAIPGFLLDAVRPLLDRDGGMFLFTAPRGGPLYEEDWRTRAWYPALRRCGLDGRGITVHSLRHAYASMAIAAGADVKTLQRQLGHSSASITLDVYASLFPSRLSEVADAVGSMRPGNSRVTDAAQRPPKHRTAIENAESRETA